MSRAGQGRQAGQEDRRGRQGRQDRLAGDSRQDEPGGQETEIVLSKAHTELQQYFSKHDSSTGLM